MYLAQKENKISYITLNNKRIAQISLWVISLHLFYDFPVHVNSKTLNNTNVAETTPNVMKIILQKDNMQS